MTRRDLPEQTNACVDPRLNEAVSAYCFGDLDQVQNEAFEIHLLECDFCWNQVAQLRQATLVLQTLPEPQEHAADIAISGNVDRSLGGHVGHVLVSATVYSVLFCLALFVEVAFDWQHLRQIPWMLTPFVFITIFLSTSGALWLDWR